MTVTTSTTILVVDDDPDSRALIRRVLTRAAPQMPVLEAANAMAGEMLVRQHRDTLALIILDVDMPQLAGTQAVFLYQSLMRQRPIPIIPYTGKMGHEAHFDAVHCEPVVSKLGSPDELVDAVQVALRRDSVALPTHPLYPLAAGHAQLEAAKLRDAFDQPTAVIGVAQAFAVKTMLRGICVEAGALVRNIVGRDVEAGRVLPRDVRVVVADATDHREAMQLADRFGLPVLLIQFSGGRQAIPARVDGYVVVADEGAAMQVREALAAITADPPRRYRPDGGAQPIPTPPRPYPNVMIDRHWEVLWYSVYGQNGPALEGILGVDTDALKKIKQRIREKLGGVSWEEALIWARAQIDAQADIAIPAPPPRVAG